MQRTAGVGRFALPTSRTGAILLEAVLSPERPVRELERNLFSALDPADEGAPYDARAAVYDRAVSSPLYSRLAWGVLPSSHTDFIQDAFDSAQEGWVLDVAAGSCAQSALVYSATSRPIVVLDRSLAMLRRGMARLRRLNGEIPARVHFLQADAASLPLRSNSVATVVCHGAFHLFTSPPEVCAEWRRVLRERGSLYASSLTRGRWIGDRYLRLLYRAGEVSEPRSAAQFAREIGQLFGGTAQLECVGNFAYVRVRGGVPPAC